jgi:hypothetical protein
MQFHLVFSGRLSASGNSSKKSEEIRDIRDKLHPQLALLWETSPALRRLRNTAIVAKDPAQFLGCATSPFEIERDPQYPIQDGHVDLCEPITRNGKTYKPLVRKSLDLNCHLKILFLRQEDPGSLVLQGGDLDNRIKTLCDALTMPNVDMAARYEQQHDPICCLLESDTLISGFDVQTDRLLFPESQFPNEVHLTINVTLKVLKVGEWNISLLG